jgi:hypothetical protein
MTVLARFYVAEVALNASGYSAVKLNAVTRGEENKVWSQYTPSGTITMSVKTDSTAGAFFAENLGKDIGITFEATEYVA